LENQFLYLYEKKPTQGWGIYLINTKPDNQILIEVPTPMDDWGIMEAGFWLLKSLNGRSLAIAGTKQTTNIDGSSDLLKNQMTVFHTFQKEFGYEHTLQIRGQAKSTII